jgi:hypothetical protein
MADSLLLPLRNCCLACERTTELALLGKCAERFSAGARRKHAEDLKERAADEAMQDRWAKGAIRVDEVAKKREGRETGLRETDPPAEEDEDAAQAAAAAAAGEEEVGLSSGAILVVDRTLRDAAATQPSSTADEPSLLETPLSTPATDETSASTATTTTSASSLPQTPPLSPSAASSPSPAGHIRPLPTSPAAASSSGVRPSSARSPPRVHAQPAPTGPHAGKRKLWGMSLGPLPAFANPFVAHRSEADSGVAGIAGGHGRFS